jgi:hypothetical protein
MNVSKIASGVAGALALAMVLAPAVSANTIKIKNNGANSKNTVKVTSSSLTAVGQVNLLAVGTLVGSGASTGGNKANNNTGPGVVKSTSGAADSTVNVTVAGPSNTATLPTPCPCDSTDVTVSGNGEKSTNSVTVTQNQTALAFQGNAQLVFTGVYSDAATGGNSANGNTGGDVTQKSGDASSNVTVDVTGPSNTLNP